MSDRRSTCVPSIRPALVAPSEFGRRPQLPRDAGERFVDLRPQHQPLADGRVVDAQPLARDLSQDDEMVKIPVHHGGQAQFAEMRHVQAHRPGAQAKRPGHLHDIGQRQAAVRYGIVRPARRRIGAQAVKAGDHGEADEATFGRLGLPSTGSLRANPKLSRSDTYSTRARRAPAVSGASHAAAAAKMPRAPARLASSVRSRLPRCSHD